MTRDFGQREPGSRPSANIRVPGKAVTSDVQPSAGCTDEITAQCQAEER